ncbi:hypothetical protein [Nocardia huaxiensis]|uniref:Uncharacterized protein n=1 Tax=Nocardia huaxiensis TaxID=2755382 RepID=A0A7D6VGM2_9NOCA|nr:hypothetical protein [Nocardia huaxiensis]QLY34002.1 hypothetical protein H0264_18760 [Nocardia huaxiensis]UFS99095.1 hypothetical protein LPY97_14950 [Nocardia huaxiensis]
MEPEHEEAMRADFAECVRLTDEIYHAEHLGATNQELDQYERSINRLGTAWTQGPHHEEWHYLRRAFAAWTSDPDAARRHLEWARYCRDEVGQDQLTAVQWRSIEQAQELSGNTFAVDYERNAPDVYRCAPGTPIPKFGADRDRAPIERSR